MSIPVPRSIASVPDNYGTVFPARSWIGWGYIPLVPF